MLAALHYLAVWPVTWPLTTRFAYRLMQSSLSKRFIPLYVRFFKVNMAEAALPVDKYATIADLFLRDLKPEARPLHPDEEALVAPVDGEIVACGKVRRDAVLSAKGVSYSLQGLLGDSRAAERFVGGSFVVIYMSAGVYHHVHSPCAAKVVAARFLPGRHFPLYELSRLSVRGLYSRNTRQVNYLQVCGASEAGAVFALVQVASALVGTIQNRFDVASVAVQRPSFAKGEELGRFSFGSTVILIFPPGMMQPKRSLRPGDRVLIGQRIGCFTREGGS